MSSLAKWTALVVFGLGVLYLEVLIGGLASIDGPGQSIGEPWFTLMELLILAQLPGLILLFALLHARATDWQRPLALAAALSIGIAAGITAMVHFSILTLSRTARFETWDHSQLLFGFEWPSLAYALDILAWDFFFALAMLLVAPTFAGGGMARLVRWLVLASGVLALAGLAGVVMEDMAVRNIGILGYAVAWPLAALAMSRLFAAEGNALAAT